MKATEDRGQLWRELDRMAVSQQQRVTAYGLLAVCDLDTALRYLAWLRANPDAPVVRSVEAALMQLEVTP